MLSQALGTNTRFVPPATAVSHHVKEARRKERGGSIGDRNRVDLIVRRHLIQRQFVLLYIPGYILVLSTPFALELASMDGRNMVVSDAKCDTVANDTFKWLSIRGPSKGGAPTQPYAIWLSPIENHETIAAGAGALRDGVACLHPNCDHKFRMDYNTTGQGSFRMTRVCKSDYAPAVCIDKHMPSFKGFLFAGFGHRFLCDYHASNCYGEKLKKLGIKGEAAMALDWGFRLVKRSTSIDQAFELHEQLVKYTWLEVLEPEPLWTLEQAQLFLEYFEACWMYPEFILRSWIDADGLSQEDYVSTTGAAESSHSWWRKFMQHSVSLHSNVQKSQSQ